MSINFPSSPTPGQVYFAEGTVFVWTGTVWAVAPAGLTFATQAEAEAGLIWDEGMSPLRGAQAIDALYTVSPELPQAICVAACISAGTTLNFSANILSVAKPSTGVYDFMFITPMPDLNYFTFGLCEPNTANAATRPLNAVSPDDSVKALGSFRMRTGFTGGQSSSLPMLQDVPRMHVMVFAWL